MDEYSLTRRVFLSLLIVALPLSGYAKDLGAIGTTYPVLERDALEEIEERARQVDWGKLFNAEKNEQKVKSYKPKDLVRLPRATRDRVRMVDISYTLDFDIPDGKGNILYPKGFTFNPLDYIVYPRTIVVINGSDRKQVEWFKKSSYLKNLNTVLWITDGSYYDLATELGMAVYYANAMIVERFNLMSVPCIIVQKKNLLEVTEVDVESRSNKRPS
jgi:conjugal transfer pilus assembly protein TraW